MHLFGVAKGRADAVEEHSEDPRLSGFEVGPERGLLDALLLTYGRQRDKNRALLEVSTGPLAYRCRGEISPTRAPVMVLTL